MNSINTMPPSEPIDRDIPDLTVGKKKNNMTLLALAGAALIAVIIIVTGIAMYMNQLEQNKREKVAEQAKARPKEDAAVVAKADFRTAQARIAKEEVAAAGASASEAAEAAALKAAAAAGGGMAVPADAIGVTATGTRPTSAAAYGQTPAASSGAHQVARVQTRAERQMDGEVLVMGGESGKAFGDDGSRLPPPTHSPSQAGGRAPVTEPVRGGLDDKVKPSVLLAGKAGMRPDLSMLLRRNTAIPCGVVTRIVSEHAGSVMCVVSNDVWSADGSNLLIEKGSVVHGERREAMMQGQARISVIWSRIDTPYAVFADVNSLATDPLGATGIPADVDNHLRERFGGAVLLSLIGDFGQAMANKANNGGGTIQFSNTATAGQDLASKTLEHTINIPPTGYVNQGAATTILVLRDLDFRGVYELARK